MLAVDASSCASHLAQSSARGTASAEKDQANIRMAMVLRIALMPQSLFTGKRGAKTGVRSDPGHRNGGGRETLWRACPIGALRLCRQHRSARTADARSARFQR